MKRILVILAVMFVLPETEAAEPITLRVDNIELMSSGSTGLVRLTVSGFPPGTYTVRCAIRDKTGRYLQAHHSNLPATGPADSMTFMLKTP